MRCKNKIIFAGISLIFLSLGILIGPADFFRHGFFCDVVEYNEIDEEDRLGTVNLAVDDFQTTFSPVNNYFAGFKILLDNVGGETSGMLQMLIYTSAGKLMETITVDISKINSGSWYVVYTNGQYDKNEEYQLIMKTYNCSSTPELLLVDSDYLPEESLGNNLLLGYGYARSTFSFAEKVLICMLILALWVMLLGELCLKTSIWRKYTRTMAFILGITMLFSWNYMFNSFDEENDWFQSFERGSDALVLGVIEGEKEGMGQRYGLALFYDGSGYFNHFSNEFVSDENWFNGYHRTQPQIQLDANMYTQNFMAPGTIIQFKNGDRFTITEIVSSEENYIFTLDADGPLNYYKYGDLNMATFYRENNGELSEQPQGRLVAYDKQYGLQGKIFRHLSKYLPDGHYIEILELLCCIFTAFVFSLLILLLQRKYNVLFATCFAVTFFLSTWIVNFASSEYWVVFTWFLPMLIGLVCSIWGDRQWIRRGGYIAAYMAIMLKSLCGYEYMSSVMLGLIAFPLVDFGMAVVHKDKKKSIVLLRTIFILGCMALAGFMSAICIHASMRGDGNILAGIRSIIEEDLLRRTGLGDLNDFPTEWDAFNASVWEVVRRYFHFERDIIAGIDANQFPVLCLIPVLIFIHDYITKKLNMEEIFMYVIFFLTAVSWFALAKDHSYGHARLNYVLWYFGFVQCCFYIITRRVIDCFSIRNQKAG